MWDVAPRENRVAGFVLFGPYLNATKRKIEKSRLDTQGGTLPEIDASLWEFPWTGMHIEEFVIAPRFRGQGVGKWLLYKWLQRIARAELTASQPYSNEAIEDEEPHLAYVKSTSSHHDGEPPSITLVPHVTLCVDGWNKAAIRLYESLGFKTFKSPESDRCEGRLEGVVRLDELETKLLGAMHKSPEGDVAVPLVLASNEFTYGTRSRTIYTLPNLRDEMQSRSARCSGTGILYFDTAQEALRAGSTLAAMIEWEFAAYADAHEAPEDWSPAQEATFPQREGLRAMIQNAYMRDGDDRALLQPRPPMTEGHRRPEDVTDDHIRSFILDRLMSVPTPRVLMTAAEWAAAKSVPRAETAVWSPTRSTEEEELFADKKVLVLAVTPARVQ